MPKKAKDLSALEVGRIRDVGLNFVGGVAGLGLQVSASGARSWILRVSVGGKRREIGLGGFPDVTLAGAKDAARVTKLKITEGIDPVNEARAKRSALQAERASSKTFSEAAAAYITVKEHEWKNRKHAQQWRNTLRDYAEPVIGNILVRNIEQSHVMQILEPIWLTKTETAKRVRGRVEKILDWSKVRGFRSGENPARWLGHLDMLLQAPSKIQIVEHHPALHFDEVGSFMQTLRQREGMGAKALEYAILTAARSGEVRGLKWAELNSTEESATLPADRMKGKREHKVALSKGALAILNSLPRTSDLVFPNRDGEMLSDMALTEVIRAMDEKKAQETGKGWRDLKGEVVTAHGFRSTFRDWCSERTNHPSEVAEMALAHSVRNKVEAAYRRGDLFEKRRNLMRDWDKYCSRVFVAPNVIPIGIAASK